MNLLFPLRSCKNSREGSKNGNRDRGTDLRQLRVWSIETRVRAKMKNTQSRGPYGSKRGGKSISNNKNRLHPRKQSSQSCPISMLLGTQMSRSLTHSLWPRKMKSSLIDGKKTNKDRMSWEKEVRSIGQSYFNLRQPSKILNLQLKSTEKS